MKKNTLFRKGEYSIGFVLLFFISCFSLRAAERDSSVQKQKPARYFVFGSGIDRSSVRDYGTSPLVYTGLFPTAHLGYEQSGQSSLFQINLNASTGNYKQKIFEKPFEIKAYEFELRTSYLHSVFRKNNEKSGWLIGGGLVHQLSIRNAEHFMNSGFVVDNISHACAEFGFRKSFHKPSKERKIGKITLRRPERNFILQSIVRLPLVSGFYRPGYVFIANGTKEEYKTFEQYHLNFLSFRGLFFSHAFTRLMRNGNAIRFSYDWSAITSGNKLPNRLEIANHLLQMSLLFRLN